MAEQALHTPQLQEEQDGEQTEFHDCHEPQDDADSTLQCDVTAYYGSLMNPQTTYQVGQRTDIFSEPLGLSH